jgi:hypothetical protein
MVEIVQHFQHKENTASCGLSIIFGACVAAEICLPCHCLATAAPSGSPIPHIQAS